MICTTMKCSYICRNIVQFVLATIGQLVTGFAFIVWRPEVLSQRDLNIVFPWHWDPLWIESDVDPNFAHVTKQLLGLSVTCWQTWPTHDRRSCLLVRHIARLGKWMPPLFQHQLNHQKARVFLISQNWATSPCFVLVCSCFTGAVQVLALGVQTKTAMRGAIYAQMLRSCDQIVTLQDHQLNQQLPPLYFAQTPIIPGQQGSGFPPIQVHYS